LHLLQGIFISRSEGERDRMSLIEIKDLKVHYPIRTGFWNRITDSVRAVDGITFKIEAG
jgi:ABC-type oligopeptide transport system ATPase subunit